jgi:hypothetical protein
MLRSLLPTVVSHPRRSVQRLASLYRGSLHARREPSRHTATPFERGVPVAPRFEVASCTLRDRLRSARGSRCTTCIGVQLLEITSISRTLRDELVQGIETMKQLGTDASLTSIRLDLVFLHASLLSDEQPEVQVLATPIGALIEQLRTERDVYERAQDAAVVTTARQGRRDATLDRLVVTFGGVARSVSPRLYDVFFAALSPSGVARAKTSREIAEVQRILGELARLDASDPLKTYEAPLRSALAALQASDTASEQTDTALALARSRLVQFKLRVDRVRVETHGKLQVVHGDRKLAGEYFRSSTREPEADDDSTPAPTPTPART